MCNIVMKNSAITGGNIVYNWHYFVTVNEEITIFYECIYMNLYY